MKTKKILAMLLAVIVLCVSFVGCGAKTEEERLEYLKGLPPIEAVKKAKTYREMVSVGGRVGSDNEAKQALNTKMIEYLIENNILRGYYYHNYYGYEETGSKRTLSTTSTKDTHAIYLVNENEVYFVPGDLVDPANIDTIPTMQDGDKYKFKIEEIKIYFDDDPTVNLKCKNSDGTAKLSIKYGDKEPIEVYLESDDNKGQNSYKYFTDDVESDTYAKAIGEKSVKEFNEKVDARKALKNSIPKVGMKASEVKQTKWGSPDDINKDTYSWGTKEQWCYDKYGYVYLENGVVTSVSQR